MESFDARWLRINSTCSVSRFGRFFGQIQDFQVIVGPQIRIVLPRGQIDFLGSFFVSNLEVFGEINGQIVLDDVDQVLLFDDVDVLEIVPREVLFVDFGLVFRLGQPRLYLWKTGSAPPKGTF